ncbi:hypothetical protein LSH36_1058g00001 [Paralvinella palmiformis]|uniref:ACB domain-containing protein n=1 Tax=Paralvinella palmiformis TaxID=53620 RepID=A0AAD9IWK3_9ANNE|nr:hypothetical protein LSH36_1058g00001 [Paralvinella palmiformis]
MASTRCLGRLARSVFYANNSRQIVRPAHLHTSYTRFSNIDGEFTKAKERLGTLKEDPGNEVKLNLYALFKQATVGKVNISRPGMIDFVGRAKWDAWNSLGDITQVQTTDSGDVLLKRDGKISIIQLNRPNKKNAIKTEMYATISDMLEEAGKDDSTLTVITGSLKSGKVTISTQNSITRVVLNYNPQRKFIGSFIDFPKPLIAVINGPAIGVSVTALGLFDIVYATDRANEVLLFNKKLTAEEACERGLVTEVFPDDIFQSEVWARIRKMSQLPPQTMHLSKSLIRAHHQDKLHQVNDKECKQLVERWQSEECANAVMKFFQSKPQ